METVTKSINHYSVHETLKFEIEMWNKSNIMGAAYA